MATSVMPAAVPGTGSETTLLALITIDRRLRDITCSVDAATGLKAEVACFSSTPLLLIDMSETFRLYHSRLINRSLHSSGHLAQANNTWPRWRYTKSNSHLRRKAYVSSG